ncbi:MAG: HAD-IA family hydrolase [Janthinobacterium lividum]
MTQTTRVEVETQGFLFDLDGVLISSLGSAVRCWRRWAAIYGIPDAENFELPHGVPARDIIRMLRPDVDQAEALRVIEDLEIDDVSDLQVLPGVEALLQSLPRERWTIVTSCTRRLLDARMRAAGLPEPSAVITADMVTRGKPDPEPYRRGAELLGFAPADCIVVEDAASGVAAGAGAGCRVLAVLSSTPADELGAATWIAQSLDGVYVASSPSSLRVNLPVLA